MLKKLTITLLAAAAALLPARAEDIIVDGIKYSINTSNKTAHVKIYDTSNNSEFYKGDIIIPETITSNDITYTVTSIVSGAFSGCTNLTSISIPKTITSIQSSTFSSCSALKSIDGLSGVTSIEGSAFSNCTSLQAIGDLPLLTSLGGYAFRYCQALQSIGDMPLLTSIGREAFYECSSLNTVGNMLAVKNIDYGAFTNCSPSLTLTLKDITSIGYYALATSGATYIFEGETPPTFNSSCGLDSSNKVIIPDDAVDAYMTALSIFGAEVWTQNELNQIPGVSDDYIHDYVITTSALDGTSALKKELIKANGKNVNSLVQRLKIIGSINDHDFNTIKSLPNIVNLDLSETAIEGNEIPENGLKNLVNLESIILPESLTAIGAFAFTGCSSLNSIGDLPNLETIGRYAFSDNRYASSSYTPGYCSSLKSISDMPKLKSIGQSAFYLCNALESIGDLPELTNIASGAFQYCYSLKSVGDLPNLETIGSCAFRECSSLQSFGNMNALKTVDEYAFNPTPLFEFTLPESITSVVTNAFPNISLVHFSGVTPPSFVGTSFSDIICVPAGSESAYAEALPDMLTTKIITHGTTDFDVTVSARENDSDVLNKVNEGFDKDMALNVLNLKVTGTINSYDIIVFRNKMLNLRKLDLSDATIVGSSYEYYSGCHTEDNIIGNNMFRELGLKEIILPQNATRLGNNAFNNCRNLQSITLSEQLQSIGISAFNNCSNLREIDIPENVTIIGNYAFYSCNKLSHISFPEGLTTIQSSWPGTFINCTSLTEIVLPPSLLAIPDYCFRGCSSLKTVSIPPTLKSIGSEAFEGCSSLKEFRIPAGVNSIGDGAIPNTVRDVYTYTIQPTKIGENTFGSDTYLQATLHVPDTSEKLYYWDTQWSQFQSIVNFNEPYSYFYLDDTDLIEDPDTPRIEGETDEETGETTNPDANLGSGSGLVVDGNDSQDLGNVDIEGDGKGNGTSIIGGDSNSTETGGNINIDLLNVNIPITGNRWYFFAFPFDVPCENIKFNGQMVWRYYDGEWRAMQGSGAWKNMKGEKLERGRGYIFQGSKNGTLTISVPNVSFDGKDWVNILEQFVSANPQDASWNFIGNPFQSFYELADLGFDGPITWWNPNTNSYEALSPEDDDFSMYPFMAFFVQKPEGTDGVEFTSSYQETNNQKNDPNHRANARKRRAARRSRTASDRQLINLTVTDGTNSDRTRVVFNSQASAAYEVGTDASKFISTEAPQIYSLDADNVRYAINERPANDGVVNLGFFAPTDGAFTLECTRTDCELTLKDCQMGKTITLTPGSTYEFTAKQGYDDSRFVLNAKGNGITGLDAIESEASNATYYRVNGIETNGSQRGLMIEVKKDGEASKIIR